ncbi:SDR family oxidoreductase [Mycobacterium parmense]|uniref:Oxidoreductase n=1 Tax=Mycobacterium parmense TaxID=185642 RepID=A0A7I7Z168_9MYCO|nr:SDR family NAD(P)-dependent oxidoreductase [Mycobacterium parmense]MCV7352714.1 SDR family NAD(P)-dependent oxidoreductase [Mycobacterium parmense]ORW54628.1 oxidoreductase [Mycobacterium parmense]BBZ46721.1 oxidoreductase [Mycobacterium parmense]
MRISDNTVLITGGGSGIGRGLAAALHHAGNRVVIAGRRTAALRAVAAAHPGMRYRQLDLCDAGSIRDFADALARDFPDLNVVVNNAGIMVTEDLATPDPATATAVVATNLLGPIALTSLLLPTLRSHSHGAIINVTSALAFVPLAAAPTYSATKAGLHSYTQSLRYQLRETGIRVIEIAPPRVETDMPGPGEDDYTITVDDLVAQTMAQLTARPETTEIVVDAARDLRYAERDGVYAEQFTAVNAAGLGQEAS